MYVNIVSWNGAEVEGEAFLPIVYVLRSWLFLGPNRVRNRGGLVRCHLRALGLFALEYGRVLLLALPQADA